MSADPACHGIRLENSHDRGNWELSVEINFVDESEAPSRILLSAHVGELARQRQTRGHGAFGVRYRQSYRRREPPGAR
jgi:hypothetical protein